MRSKSKRGAIWLVLLLILGTGLSACAVGLRETPVMDGLPQDFDGGGDETLADRWWEAFGDAELNRLIDEGLAGSPDLAQWWNRLDQSAALARKAGADLWPDLTLNGGASRSAQWPEDGPDVYTDSYSAGLSVSYELDLWGRVRSTKNAAALDALASRENLRSAALSLSARIASTWYQLAEARGQVEILTDQVRANEESLELTVLRFRRGQVGASDVLRSRQLVESVRGSLLLANARAEVLRHQLAVLVGRSPQEPAEDAGAELVDLPPLPETGVPADLLRRRPDLRAAHAGLASAHARLAAAVSDRFPRLSLSAGVSSGGSETSALFTDWLGNLAANLMLPLFDGGSRGAEADRQEAAAAEAFNGYRSAVLVALQEVEDALVQESGQRGYVESLTAQLDLADALVERTRDDYLGGQADYLRVLDALISQQSLQRQRITAARELIQYRIDLCRALGGDWTPARPDTASASDTERTES